MLLFCKHLKATKHAHYSFLFTCNAILKLSSSWVMLYLIFLLLFMLPIRWAQNISLSNPLFSCMFVLIVFLPSPPPAYHGSNSPLHHNQRGTCSRHEESSWNCESTSPQDCSCPYNNCSREGSCMTLSQILPSQHHIISRSLSYKNYKNYHIFH